MPEVKWLRVLLASGGVQHRQPTRFLCDNQAAIHITTNPVFEEHLKHINIDRHFVRDLLQYSMISIAHVGTKFQTSSWVFVPLCSNLWGCIGYV